METVLYIGGFKLPDKNAAAPRVINNGKILRELGYDVVYIDVADQASKNIEKNHKICDGFSAYSIKYPSGAEWIKYLTSISDFKKIYKKCQDVGYVIAYNYQAIAFLRLKRFCKRHNIKLISDCTEWYGKSNFIKNFDTDLRMKYIQKSIDGVIAISSFLEDYYKRSTKTLLLPPLTDPDSPEWERVEKEDDILTFSYVGSPGKNKDRLDMIINALSAIKTEREYVFNIIGITKEQYLEFHNEHKEVLEEMEDKIRFLGRVPKKDALIHLKSSDFSVFFRSDTIVSRAGFPTKYAEAVTSAVPVITNLTSDLGRYLKDGENGFIIKDYSEDAIKDAFFKALNTTDDELKKIKEVCNKNRDTFGYRNYKDAFGEFLRS